MIQFKNISKRYKDSTILSDISLEIPSGKLVAIIGASGCGKTTTLKMINRLINPTSGKIFIDGKDISQQEVIKLRRNIGYVIQHTGLFPHMTIRQNIEIIPRVEKLSDQQITKRTHELMEMVGLPCEQFLDRYPTQLSGGQQQRVGVARAFATDPDIILMDEPLSALDPITRAGLQDELVDLQSNFKKTIVFVTHDMDEAIKIADLICIMDKGHIVQYDTPENILKNPSNDFVAEFVGKKRIWNSPEFIKANDIVAERAITATENSSLAGCLQKMRSNQVDRLIIVSGKTKKLLGILFAETIFLQNDMTLKAGQVMEHNFISVAPDDDLIMVLEMVKNHQVSSIPVVDQDGIFNGLITRSSLITTLSQQYTAEGGE